MPLAERGPRRAFRIVYAVTWIALAWPWLSGRLTIPYDAKALYQAQLQFLANAIHSGQSVLWNPFEFLGMPQVADPQSLIFSPALLLAYLSPDPPYWLLDAYVYVLLGLAGLAVLQIFLDRGWHPGGGLLAALCFTFGGSAAWRVQHIGHMQSYAFFAIGLWLLLRALDRRSPGAGLLAGVSLGLMLIEPDQMALLACYASAIVVVAHVAGDPRGWRCGLRTSAVPVLAAGVTASVVAAMPVALCYLFLSQSNRPSVAMAEAARGSLHPASLLTLLVPALFGTGSSSVDYWGPYSEAWNPEELTLSANMCQLYLGALPLLLLVSGGIGRGLLLAREVRGIALSGLFALVYALGSHTPVYAAFHALLPGVNAFRRPVDATFLLGAASSLLAGYVLHRWLTLSMPAVSDRRKALECGLFMGGLVLAAGLALGMARFGSAWQPLLAAALWLGLATLGYLAPDPWIRQQSMAVALLPALFTAADLGINNAPSESTGLPAARIADVLTRGTANDTIALLKAQVRRELPGVRRDRIELVGIGFDWQNCPQVHGFEHTLGYNPFRIGLVSSGLGARDYIAGPDQRAFSPLFPSYRSLLADMVGLRFVASSIPIEKIDGGLRPGDLTLIARTRDAYVYENPRALPRVLLATHSQAADFSAILKDGRWPQFDPRTTVLLEPIVAGMVAAGSGAPVVATAASGAPAITMRRYENALVEIVAETAVPAFVVLNDVWHPWWSATLDGVPTPIHRANVMFRAVAVPPGRHVVQMRFTPVSGLLAQLRNGVGH